MNTLKEWKFRKNITVIPGVQITYGKNGLTTTVNQRSELDFDRQKEKLSHNIYKQYSSVDEIKSKSIKNLCSPGLTDFKEVLLSSSKENTQTKKLLDTKTEESFQKKSKLDRLNRHLFKFLFKKKRILLDEEVSLLDEEISELREQLDYSIISLEIDGEETFNDLYKDVLRAFELLKNSEKKWDVTSSKRTNQFMERTLAANTITRSEINILLSSLPLINCSQLPIQFDNINGGDIYFYPGFLIFHESNSEFAIIDYTDLDITFRQQKFIEDEKVPSDTKIVAQTWYKTNKDGSPDKRFANNFQIPVVLYGEIHFTSRSGLNEEYSFSNAETAELFYHAMNNYIVALKEAKNLLNAFTN